MNTQAKTFKLSTFAAAAGLLVAGAGLSTSASAAYDNFLKLGGVEGQSRATDSNWFNPANWSAGRVPGPEDNVILTGKGYVVIDQDLNRGGAVVQFRSLTVRDAATVEVLHGAVVKTLDQVQYDSGRIIFRGSGDIGETLVVGAGSDPSTGCDSNCNGGGVFLNPTPQNKRIIVLKSSATVDIGLGGTTPASLSVDSTGRTQLHAGRGHYATINTDTALIDGELKISQYYGFEPSPGDQYQIITVNGRRSGEFLGLPEGGYAACTENNVCLRISYEGGDGNDIVLTAETVPAGIALLLPAVQKVRQAVARSASAVESLPLAVVEPVTTGLLLPAVQKVREAASRSTATTENLPLGIGSNDATGIGLLLPAVQKVRDAAAR